MRHIGLILWCGFFFIPLAIMLVLDGFCSGGDLCRAGFTFTLLIYGIGVAVCAIGIFVARFLLRVLNASTRTRILVMKGLLLIPLVPGGIILALLVGGLLGRLG